jgi:hypothetical protein
VLVCAAAMRARAEDVVLPTQYDQDRFFVVPVIAGGEVIRLLTDTGGGVLIFDDAAMRLKLSVTGVTLTEYKGMAAKFPEFEAGKEIPAPKTEGDVVPIAPGPIRMRLSWLTKDIDGIIGQGWFGDRVWTLDYPGRKLIYHVEGKAAHSDKAHRVELGFRKNELGQRAINYPRIEVEIAGGTLDVLLATGSSVAITAEALKAIDEGGPAIQATSLISNSIFDQWKKEHPEWRVVANAEETSGEPMIEVPELTVAGFTVRNVWFTQRPDNNFSEHFSNWTDKPVVGAIGGNVLKDFRIVLDYPNAVAWFEKP